MRLWLSTVYSLGPTHGVTYSINSSQMVWSWDEQSNNHPTTKIDALYVSSCTVYTLMMIYIFLILILYNMILYIQRILILPFLVEQIIPTWGGSRATGRLGSGSSTALTSFCFWSQNFEAVFSKEPHFDHVWYIFCSCFFWAHAIRLDMPFVLVGMSHDVTSWLLAPRPAAIWAPWDCRHLRIQWSICPVQFHQYVNIRHYPSQMATVFNTISQYKHQDSRSSSYTISKKGTLNQVTYSGTAVSLPWVRRKAFLQGSGRPKKTHGIIGATNG